MIFDLFWDEGRMHSLDRKDVQQKYFDIKFLIPVKLFLKKATGIACNVLWWLPCPSIGYKGRVTTRPSHQHSTQTTLVISISTKEAQWLDWLASCEMLPIWQPVCFHFTDSNYRPLYVYSFCMPVYQHSKNTVQHTY